MRDGIYKDGPAPALWQRTANACRNDADWQDAGLLRARRALLADVRKQLDPAALKRLRERAEQRQPNLFDTAWTLWREAAPERSPTTQEEGLLSHIEHRAAGKTPSVAHLYAGLQDVLREMCMGRFRETRTMLWVHAQKDCSTILPRLSQVLQQVPLADYAAALLNGQHPRLPRLGGAGVDLDGDLP